MSTKHNGSYFTADGNTFSFWLEDCRKVSGVGTHTPDETCDTSGSLEGTIEQGPAGLRGKDINLRYVGDTVTFTFR